MFALGAYIKNFNSDLLSTFMFYNIIYKLVSTEINFHFNNKWIL